MLHISFFSISFRLCTCFKQEPKYFGSQLFSSKRIFLDRRKSSFCILYGDRTTLVCMNVELTMCWTENSLDDGDKHRNIFCETVFIFNHTRNHNKEKMLRHFKLPDNWQNIIQCSIPYMYIHSCPYSCVYIFMHTNKLAFFGNDTRCVYRVIIYIVLQRKGKVFIW